MKDIVKQFMVKKSGKVYIVRIIENKSSNETVMSVLENHLVKKQINNCRR